MTLLAALDKLLATTRHAFRQDRTFWRARQLAFAFLVCLGRRTVSRALCTFHAQFQDWTAHYRLFSRAPWDPRDLFQPVIEQALEPSNTSGPVVVALDDTSLPKTGRRIPGVGYTRDPMSPPFHVNLRRGQRFLQASLLLRPEGLDGPARAIPIRYHPAPPPPKPGKRATEADLQAYHQAKKTQNLSCQAVQLIQDIRTHIDQAGHASRVLLLAVDGSFCNGTVFRNLPERVQVIARAREDLRLFQPPDEDEPHHRGRRRQYGAPLPKPKAIRTRDDFPWHTAKVFGAGRLHEVRYKVVAPVLWRSGTRTLPLRLIIIAPLRYRPTSRSRLLYRDPAYLLTTDLTTPVVTLLQAYFDRWEIEVNHRDEKSLLGVGQAQVWSEKAAYRLPQFQVAIYAMLLLASLMAYGPKRTEQYLPLPKWRKPEVRRPSTLDILALLREELLQQAIAQNSATASRRPRASARPSTLSAPRGSSPPGRGRTATNPTPEKCPADVVSAALHAFS